MRPRFKCRKTPPATKSAILVQRDTCELNGANPFDYLSELQNHAVELAENQAAWMPWNYHLPLPPATTNQNPA